MSLSRINLCRTARAEYRHFSMDPIWTSFPISHPHTYVILFITCLIVLPHYLGLFWFTNKLSFYIYTQNTLIVISCLVVLSLHRFNPLLAMSPETFLKFPVKISKPEISIYHILAIAPKLPRNSVDEKVLLCQPNGWWIYPVARGRLALERGLVYHAT